MLVSRTQIVEAVYCPKILAPFKPSSHGIRMSASVLQSFSGVREHPRRSAGRVTLSSRSRSRLLLVVVTSYTGIPFLFMFHGSNTFEPEPHNICTEPFRTLTYGSGS